MGEEQATTDQNRQLRLLQQDYDRQQHWEFKQIDKHDRGNPSVQQTDNFGAFAHKYTYPSDLQSADRECDNLQNNGSQADSQRRTTGNFDFLSNEEFLKHGPSKDSNEQLNDDNSQHSTSPKSRQIKNASGYKEGRAQIEGGSRMAQRQHNYQDLIEELVDMPSDNTHQNSASLLNSMQKHLISDSSQRKMIQNQYQKTREALLTGGGGSSTSGGAEAQNQRQGEGSKNTILSTDVPKELPSDRKAYFESLKESEPFCAELITSSHEQDSIPQSQLQQQNAPKKSNPQKKKQKKKKQGRFGIRNADLDDVPLKTIEIIRPTKKGQQSSSAGTTTTTTTTSAHHAKQNHNSQNDSSVQGTAPLQAPQSKNNQAKEATQKQQSVQLQGSQPHDQATGSRNNAHKGAVLDSSSSIVSATSTSASLLQSRKKQNKLLKQSSSVSQGDEHRSILSESLDNRLKSSKVIVGKDFLHPKSNDSQTNQSDNNVNEKTNKKNLGGNHHHAGVGVVTGNASPHYKNLKNNLSDRDVKEQIPPFSSRKSSKDNLSEQNEEKSGQKLVVKDSQNKSEIEGSKFKMFDVSGKMSDQGGCLTRPPINLTRQTSDANPFTSMMLNLGPTEKSASSSFNKVADNNSSGNNAMFRQQRPSQGTTATTSNRLIGGQIRKNPTTSSSSALAATKLVNNEKRRTAESCNSQDNLKMSSSNRLKQNVRMSGGSASNSQMRPITSQPVFQVKKVTSEGGDEGSIWARLEPRVPIQTNTVTQKQTSTTIGGGSQTTNKQSQIEKGSHSILDESSQRGGNLQNSPFGGNLGQNSKVQVNVQLGPFSGANQQLSQSSNTFQNSNVGGLGAVLSGMNNSASGATNAVQGSGSKRKTKQKKKGKNSLQQQQSAGITSPLQSNSANASATLMPGGGSGLINTNPVGGGGVLTSPLGVGGTQRGYSMLSSDSGVFMPTNAQNNPNGSGNAGQVLGGPQGQSNQGVEDFDNFIGQDGMEHAGKGSDMFMDMTGSEGDVSQQLANIIHFVSQQIRNRESGADTTKRGQQTQRDLLTNLQLAAQGVAQSGAFGNLQTSPGNSQNPNNVNLLKKVSGMGDQQSLARGGSVQGQLSGPVVDGLSEERKIDLSQILGANGGGGPMGMDSQLLIEQGIVSEEDDKFHEMVSAQVKNTVKSFERRLDSVRKEREAVIQIIEAIVREVFDVRKQDHQRQWGPQVPVEVKQYGSQASSLAVDSSDVDLAVTGLKFNGDIDLMIQQMQRLRDNFETRHSEGYIKRLELIDSATIPLIKMQIDLQVIQEITRNKAALQAQKDNDLNFVPLPFVLIDSSMQILNVDITFDDYNNSVLNHNRLGNVQTNGQNLATTSVIRNEDESADPHRPYFYLTENPQCAYNTQQLQNASSTATTSATGRLSQNSFSFQPQTSQIQQFMPQNAQISTPNHSVAVSQQSAHQSNNNSSSSAPSQPMQNTGNRFVPQQSVVVHSANALSNTMNNAPQLNPLQSCSLAITSVHMIKELQMKYIDLRNIVLIIKKLLAKHNLHKPYTGGLGSYSIVLMTSTYLERFGINKFSALSKNLQEFLKFYGKYFNPQENGLDGTKFFQLTPEQRITGDQLFVIDIQNSANNTARSAFRIDEIRRVFWEAHQQLITNLVKFRNEPDKEARMNINVIKQLIY